jgi:hypothetical protein
VASEPVRRLYAGRKDSLFLIRPDGYVGFRSVPADEQSLLPYLEKIFLPPG